MGTFQMPVRSYRVYPLPGQAYDDRNYGHVHKTVEFDTANTAVIAIDMWNLGGDGDPVIPGVEKYWEYNYMGGHGVAKRAGKIMVEEIVPVLEAARDAGVPVIHNEPRQVLARYPWAEPPEPAPVQADNDTLNWPPPEFRRELLAEYHSTVFGAGYREPWSKIQANYDFADCVKPDQRDHLFSQPQQIERFLAERKILNLVYVGFLLNFCLLMKPGGILQTRNRYRAIVLRDCTAASEAAWSTDENLITKAFIHWLEIGGALTANSKDFREALSQDQSD